MNPLGSVELKVERFLPDGTILPMGHKGSPPDNWSEMDEWQRLRWCIEHGAHLIVSVDVYEELKRQYVERSKNDGWRA